MACYLNIEFCEPLDKADKKFLLVFQFNDDERKEKLVMAEIEVVDRHKYAKKEEADRQNELFMYQSRFSENFGGS